uniref:Putative secreted protein n=1 Tax=Ixodes ricinus TaxID=34613 RepID=A0A6B0UU38_IXORI
MYLTTFIIVSIAPAHAGLHGALQGVPTDGALHPQGRGPHHRHWQGAAGGGMTGSRNGPSSQLAADSRRECRHHHLHQLSRRRLGPAVAPRRHEGLRRRHTGRGIAAGDRACRRRRRMTDVGPASGLLQARGRGGAPAVVETRI